MTALPIGGGVTEVAEYGLAQLERALKFAKATEDALDVGCGSKGRFIQCLLKQGYRVEGLDVAPRMIEIVAKRYPNCTFHVTEISQWTFPKHYDFISAWDSTFHLPLDLQEPVLREMCAGLNQGGVLLFTCGGGEEPGEISRSFGGEDFDYSTLVLRAFSGCYRIVDAPSSISNPINTRRTMSPSLPPSRNTVCRSPYGSSNRPRHNRPSRELLGESRQLFSLLPRSCCCGLRWFRVGVGMEDSFVPT